MHHSYTQRNASTGALRLRKSDESRGELLCEHVPFSWVSADYSAFLTGGLAVAQRITKLGWFPPPGAACCCSAPSCRLIWFMGGWPRTVRSKVSPVSGRLHLRWNAGHGMKARPVYRVCPARLDLRRDACGCRASRAITRCIAARRGKARDIAPPSC